MKKEPIDKLFEEKLRDYSEVPDEKIWKAIEASLDKKRKSRRVIPIWWKLGGAAAVIAFLFYMLGPEGFNADTETPVTNTEETRLPEMDENNPLIQESPIESGEDNAVTSVPEDTNSSGAEDPSDTSDRQPVSIQQNRTSRQGNISQQPALKQDAVVQNDGDPAATKAPGPVQATVREATAGEVAAATPAPDRQAETQDQEARQPADTRIAQVADKDAEDRKQPEKDIITGPARQPGEQEAQVAEAVKEEEKGKISIYDEIIKAQEEEEALAAAEGNKWTVGPKIAPVYFSSFGNGSPIHSSFAANSKSGNVNLSYGLSLAYNISPRLSVRSGVHKVDYGYNTNDISFSPTLSANSGQQLNTINYALTSRNLVVRNSSEAKVVQDAVSAEVAAEFPARNGRMVQQFGYVEVPLELNLALVERKLGLNLIGGVSSLFLVDNSVTLESDGSSMEMGEANNLNSVNFSTNLGVGVQYEVSSGILLNLEPVFKYQLNTFSETAGSFNPYSIGVYSGISFRF